MTDKTTAADKKAPPPTSKPDPKPEPVAFVSPARGKRVYDKAGNAVAKFRDGEFSTSDESLVALLDGLPDVRRADD